MCPGAGQTPGPPISRKFTRAWAAVSSRRAPGFEAPLGAHSHFPTAKRGSVAGRGEAGADRGGKPGSRCAGAGLTGAVGLAGACAGAGSAGAKPGSPGLCRGHRGCAGENRGGNRGHRGKKPHRGCVRGGLCRGNRGEKPGSPRQKPHRGGENAGFFPGKAGSPGRKTGRSGRVPGQKAGVGACCRGDFGVIWGGA